jgi:hypothetical protein
MLDAHARLYTAAQIVVLLVAARWVVRGRIDLFSLVYVRTLLRPWRLVTGMVATAFFVLAAPYAGDPTWDRAVGLIMSVPTYVSASWSVGALWKVARRERSFGYAWVALCAWAVSASWGYDHYNWWRHGHYPAAWAANFVASSVLYALAGLCWSLCAREGVGVTFTFLWPEWPGEGTTQPHSLPLVVGVAVFVLAAALLGLPFVLPSLAWWN